MLRKVSLLAINALLLALAAVSVHAESAADARNPDAVRRLEAESGDNDVGINPATGTARFVRVKRAGAVRAAARAAAPEVSAQTAKDSASSFIARHSQAFGLNAGMSELKLRRMERDEVGKIHLTYTQEYAGLPVFGAEIKAHLDTDGQVAAVTGTAVPDIAMSTAPKRSATQVGDTAIQRVSATKEVAGLTVRGSRLMIFREGLAKGVPGDNHLAYEVEVGNGTNVREFVYVDANTGKFIDQITGIPDALDRRAYDGANLPRPPPSYPGSPFWAEGAPFPTGVAEADNMILASKETYDLYFNGFGRDSFDGAGAKMDSIFNRGYSCPNASWNGIFISFCPGLTTDDVTAHEWSHAYTQYTDNLIYQWQPGALNEASSDIFGETVDRLNGRGGDSPDNPRTANSCTIYAGAPPPTLTITGGSAAGPYFSLASANEPAKPFTRGPTEMAVATPASACTAVSGVAGKIAIIDFTLLPSGASQCGSGARATNARLAGATAIIFVAPPSGTLFLGGSALIASVEVSNADGARIKAGLPASATMTLGVGTDNSVRWLLGEDSTAAGLTGALRDMWTPECLGNPGKVSAPEYSCSTVDQGGVHSNSGVDNHAYALLVDGGVFNGQTISGLGLTKAAHIYFRAKTHYQGPASDFADHADALEHSCADLVGVNLKSLKTGAPSGEVIAKTDCVQVAKTMLAVEMRSPPTQCGFTPLLAKSPPPLCAANTRVKKLFQDRFERDDDDGDHDRDDDRGGRGLRGWRVSHEGTITPDFTPRDWTISSKLPGERRGSAFFGPDPDLGTCGPGGDESAVLHLDSPKIELQGNVKSPYLAFDHWVATEPDFDGGNLKISVNGGPWQLVKAEDFVYNPYNATLLTADVDGNTNPIAGQDAFSGTDGGSVEGSWGRSIINLAPYAKAKDKIRLRFDLGNDCAGGRFGWYVDDVTVYQCKARDKDRDGDRD